MRTKVKFLINCNLEKTAPSHDLKVKKKILNSFQRRIISHGSELKAVLVGGGFMVSAALLMARRLLINVKLASNIELIQRAHCTGFVVTQ